MRASYSYDTAARLRNETFTGDGTGGVTSSRSYSLDADSNRIGQTVTGSGAQTRRGAFNAADQLITSTSGSTAGSYKYDSFGRTTALPGVDSASGDTTLTWKANDRVAIQTSAGHAMTYTDDPTDRRVGVADTTDSQIQYMYADDSDEPAMLRTTAAGATKTQRFTDTPMGGLGVTTTSLASTGVRKLWSDQQSVTSELNLSNPHGDVIATIPNTPNVTKDQMTPVSTYTAFGLDQPNSTGKDPYGWESSNQRDTINTAGLITMGARLYNPTTGRFLTLDPVEGGNANNYMYPADPVNGEDLNGQWGWVRRVGSWINRNKVDIALTAAMFVPGLGAAAAVYRGYRVYRAARTAYSSWRRLSRPAQQAYNKSGAGRYASRPTSWVAGRFWKRRVASSSYRRTHRTTRHGWRSNLEVYGNNRGNHRYFNYHLKRRRSRWW